MRFSIISAVLLLGGTAAAAPGTAMRRARALEHLSKLRGSLPRQREPQHQSSGPLAAPTSRSNDRDGNETISQLQDYSSNWAGAVLYGNSWRTVVGTIVVPTPKPPAGASSRTTYYASAWVGIDGDSCPTAILQTGIDVAVTGAGKATYSGWYEWYPDYAYDFSNFAVKAGDTVRITVKVAANNLRQGTATLENLTTGRSVSHTFGTQSAALCGTDAEWIVEDFESDGGLVPLANFGKVVFSDASAGQAGGSTLGVTGANVIDLKQSGRVLTSCGVDGTKSVFCSYTGP